MGTSGDIRTLFEMAMNENARTIEGAILPPLQKLLGTGRINSKGGGKDLRFDLGGEDKKSIKKISSAFSKLKQSSIKIEAVAAGEYKDAARKEGLKYLQLIQDRIDALEEAVGDI